MIEKLLLEIFASKGVYIPRLVLDMLDGDYHAAAMLCQCLHWQKITTLEDGWFAKSAEEWLTEICLTRKHLERATKVLSAFGLETKIERSPFHRYAPVKFYRVNLELLAQKAQAHIDALYSQEPSENPPETQDGTKAFVPGVQNETHSECKSPYIIYRNVCQKRMRTDLHPEGANAQEHAPQNTLVLEQTSDSKAAASQKKKRIEREAKAKRLLIAFRKARYPTSAEYSESDFQQYKRALFALVDDNRTEEEIHRATIVAMCTFSQKTMVTLNSIARHLDELLERSDTARKLTSGSHSEYSPAPAPGSATLDDAIEEQMRYIREINAKMEQRT